MVRARVAAAAVAMDVPPDRQVADYFVHCGLPEQLCELDAPLEDFPIKPSHNYAPITDVAVIFPADEPVPAGFRCIEKTPTGRWHAPRRG